MKRVRGFSLIELILVIVILGVVAGVITVFVRPAVEGWVSQRFRSEMQGAAQSALQAMNRDARAAVPNSIRSPSDQCFELVPAIGGGRYRMAADIVNDAAVCSTTADCSAAMDTGIEIRRFDVLGPLNGSAAAGDFVVVGNQNGDEVYKDYASSNRSVLTNVNDAMAKPAFGSQRLAFEPRQFPVGYAGGRFQIVAAGEQSVFYNCVGAGVDARGNGTGTLYRLRRNFTSAYPANCPAAGGDVLATRVSACSFSYSGLALTERGLLSLRLELRRDNERVGLQFDSMTSNIP